MPPPNSAPTDTSVAGEGFTSAGPSHVDRRGGLLRRVRTVSPAELVLVRRDGQWCDGELHAWRRDPDGWVGYVLYAVDAGLRHLEWVGSERLQKQLDGPRAHRVEDIRT
jgi:hypothetical protein